MSNDHVDIGLPGKITVRHHGPNLEIARTWFGGRVLFMTAFVIVWDGFLVFWYRQALVGDVLMMKLFPLIHVGVGLWLTYYTIAGYLNKTYVLVNYEKITVRHRPLPYWGHKTVRSRDLKQLYSKEKVSRSSRSTSVSYEIRGLTHDGKNMKIVSGLETSEQALFVEQEVERYLGIKDKAVRGEIRR